MPEPPNHCETQQVHGLQNNLGQVCSLINVFAFVSLCNRFVVTFAMWLVMTPSKLSAENVEILERFYSLSFEINPAQFETNQGGSNKTC